MEIDTKDLKILQLLQENARTPNIELAKATEMAPSTVLERVRRLEEKGLIRAYRAVLDRRQLDLQVEAIVMISLHRHKAGAIDPFEDRIRGIPEVTACWHITGRYDYAVHVVVRDNEHLGEVVKHSLGAIPGIEKQETFLTLSQVKEDQGLPLPK